MFDKLFEIIALVWDQLIPWEVIPHYDRGVRLRLGKRRVIKRVDGEPVYEPVLEHGYHWKIPFVDQINTIMVKAKTMNLSEQTITTKDDKSIVVRAVVKFEIDDVITTLLETNDPVEAVNDMTKGIIRNTFIKKDWNECNTVEVSREIREKARTEGKKWGIKIVDVTLTDLGQVPSYRIFNSDGRIL